MSRIFAITKYTSLVGLFFSLAAAALPALGAIKATATISTSSASAPYAYTITLHNTGTTDIGSFWFAWTDVPIDYNFLPTLPTVTGMPTGWIAPITHNASPDGYGIEYENSTGLAIPTGGSATFSFNSDDSPAIIAGNGYIFPNKVTRSAVYIGAPQNDAGFKFNVAVVPEPSSMVLACIAAGGGLILWSKSRSPRVAPFAITANKPV